MILSQPSRESGCIVGSHFTGNTIAAGVLTPDQIKSKYGLSGNDLERLKRQLYRSSVLDALYHFPDGPAYDLLLWLVATTR